jgi:hypothetical protein
MKIDVTQRDVQDTFDYLYQEAAKVMEMGGSFAPFGAATRMNGERTHVNVDLPIERSTPNDHISGLIMGFRKEAEAGRIYIAGLAFDGKVAVNGEQREALVVHIEHDKGEGLEIFVPYERGAAGQKISFGQPIIQNIIPEIFSRAA